MSNQVRILVLLTAVALALGWWSVRRGNAALEARLAAAPAGEVRR
ncbi:MAG TPA: hypothetical protein VFM53_05280 [Anaeromyxobacteraceae bacterium]|nr:hypothetical protein [Anaeromyxobacteraceae bacterium]